MSVLSHKNKKLPNPITAKIRSKDFFRVIAKFVYPKKTATAVSALTGFPERTIYDWLSGQSRAPWSVFVMLFGEIEHGVD